MYLLDAGHSSEHIHTTYGINAAYLKVLRSKYLQQGKNIKDDFVLGRSLYSKF